MQRTSDNCPPCHTGALSLRPALHTSNSWNAACRGFIACARSCSVNSPAFVATVASLRTARSTCTTPGGQSCCATNAHMLKLPHLSFKLAPHPLLTLLGALCIQLQHPSSIHSGLRQQTPQHAGLLTSPFSIMVPKNSRATCQTLSTPFECIAEHLRTCSKNSGIYIVESGDEPGRQTHSSHSTQPQPLAPKQGASGETAVELVENQPPNGVRP